MTEKLKNLTNKQKQALNTLTTVEEVAAFAAKAGIDLTAEEAAEIAKGLQDKELSEVAGGAMAKPLPRPFPPNL
jgi:hypothetical protein